MIPIRSVLGVIVSITAVVFLLSLTTRGFSALTVDAARALDVAATPVRVPDVTIKDFQHHTYTMRDNQRSTIVDFVYTRCTTVCVTLGGAYQSLQHAIQSRGLESQVRLLSISFDPTKDTEHHLAVYGQALHAAPPVWTIGTLAEPQSLAALLRTFGVRVIADKLNGFTHNAALHIVTPDGLLVRILPVENTDEALDLALQYAQEHSARHE